MEKKIHQVGSIGEICSILKHADRSVEQEFVLSDDASLSDARKVWKLVNTEEGGYGVLANPALLSSKEDAYQFVDKRIEGLRRLVRNSDRLHTNLTASTQHLEAVLEEGGPGLQASYDPKVFHEVRPFIDTDQEISEKDLEKHIQQLQAMILQGVGSPRSPASSEEAYNSALACKDREVLEQRALTEFNEEFLRLKLKVLSTARKDLQEGIEHLEVKYLQQPTHLGCGSADYVRFKNLPMFPGERKGSTW